MTSAVTASGRPVTVMTASASATARSIGATRIPSNAASSARTASRSTTITFAPRFRSVRARLRPHEPKPTTANVFAATRLFVARMNPSTTAGPIPCSFSNRSLIGLSLITITGKSTRPASSPSSR